MACLSHVVARDILAVTGGPSEFLTVDGGMLEEGPIRPLREVQPRPIDRGAFFADLRRPLDLNYWWISPWKNDHPGSVLAGPWMTENVIQTPDRLVLRVIAGQDGAKPTMAELKTRQQFGYGRYEVIMRPSAESGVVSSFFTYTGPLDGTPHDEVDIEFTGNRARAVEYNYWKNKESGAHSRESLDFDISDRMNLYAFEWHPDEIIWFVNGEEHYRTPPNDTLIPSHPGNIFINIWTGVPAMHSWTGPPDFGDSAEAEYACVSFTSFEGSSYSCADLWEEDPQFQYDDVWAAGD